MASKDLERKKPARTRRAGAGDAGRNDTSQSAQAEPAELVVLRSLSADLQAMILPTDLNPLIPQVGDPGGIGGWGTKLAGLLTQLIAWTATKVSSVNGVIADASGNVQIAVGGSTAGSLQQSANLADLASPSSARTNLGLGSAAVQPATAFDAAGAAANAQTAVEAELTAYVPLAAVDTASGIRPTTGTPVALATDLTGDFAFDSAAAVIYGPFTGTGTTGSWPAGVPLATVVALAQKRGNPTLLAPATAAVALTKDAIQPINPSAALTNTPLPALSAATVGDTYWLRNQASFAITQPFAGSDTTSDGATSFVSFIPGLIEIACVANPAAGTSGQPAKFWTALSHVHSDGALATTYVPTIFWDPVAVAYPTRPPVSVVPKVEWIGPASQTPTQAVGADMWDALVGF